MNIFHMWEKKKIFDVIFIVRVLTRAFVRNYSKCMVRLNTQTEFAVNKYQKSFEYIYSVSKQNKSVMK